MQRNNVVSLFFTADHARLDMLFEQYRQKRAENPKPAGRYFTAFAEGLKRHIDWEERLLFPVFEQQTGHRDTGPTAVMRYEHQLIVDVLDGLDKALKDNGGDLDEMERRLAELLEAHNQKEEHMLYPMIDQLLSGEMAADIFTEIERALSKK